MFILTNKSWRCLSELSRFENHCGQQSVIHNKNLEIPDPIFSLLVTVSSHFKIHLQRLPAGIKLDSHFQSDILSFSYLLYRVVLSKTLQGE